METKDVSIEQRAHDIALLITEEYLSREPLPSTDTHIFEIGVYYRNVYKWILRSLEEGKSDLA